MSLSKRRRWGGGGGKLMRIPMNRGGLCFIILLDKYIGTREYLNFPIT